MKIDKEYATQLMDEVKWLSNHGIKYTFVKVTEEKTENTTIIKPETETKKDE